MTNELLTGTDWDYAGLTFNSNRSPLLLERTNFKSIIEDNGILTVELKAAGDHPFKPSPVKASSKHCFQVSDIVGITYFKDIVPAIIQTGPGILKP